ncbi:helix-turn-helix domain-containing protein [Pelagicoccus sp. SDUM812002]|uniref:helix-turn-helix domain-containing protein n=1 Tax=Pelagicoccus sp. SDUM812002 TaxID=3041266 RepID=UPI00280C3FE0|nr:helix-turn-helix domain-containing protein [Pelagicoccus sp. SDUM812002]MDQ8183969.1 helix-turn-helix domain-containing protein [Pelagicoccus sp. SDUM812002]
MSEKHEYDNNPQHDHESSNDSKPDKADDLLKFPSSDNHKHPQSSDNLPLKEFIEICFLEVMRRIENINQIILEIKSANTPMSELMTVKETAIFLRKSEATIRYWLDEGFIPAYCIEVGEKSARLVSKSKLLQFLEDECA